MNITRVPHDGAEYIYKVDDEDTLQGVFFVIIDPESRTLAISVIDLTGEPDQADMLLIAARVNDPEYDQERESLIWQYIGDQDLVDRLTQLVGNDSAIILTDLGLTGANPDDPAWAAAMAGQDTPVSVVTPDAVQSSDYSFEFDPAGASTSAIPPANSDDQVTGTTDFDVPEPEPGPGELPADDDEEEEEPAA